MTRPIKYRVRELASHEVIGYEALIDGQWRYRIEGSHWMIGVFTLPGLIREQYTGLVDSTKRMIYESDVVEHTLYSPSEVFFRDGSFCTDLDRRIYLELSQNSFGMESYTVIGDIHQNPELLNPTHGTL